MKFSQNLIYAFSLLVFTACTSSMNDDMTPPEPAPRIFYEVTFQGVWTSDSHPQDYPSGAHFSPLFVASHAQDYPLYRVNTSASPGLQIMAETGGTSTLKAEVQQDALVREVSVGSGTSATGTVKIVVEVDENFDRLSVVTMVAPSPDWFLGVKNVELRNNEGAWQDLIELDMQTLDSGTDSGSSFASANQPTEPRGVVDFITGAPLGDGEKVSPALGTLSIKLLSSN